MSSFSSLTKPQTIWELLSTTSFVVYILNLTEKFYSIEHSIVWWNITIYNTTLGLRVKFLYQMWMN